MQLIIIDVRRDTVDRTDIADTIQNLVQAKHMSIIQTPPGIALQVLDIQEPGKDDIPKIALNKNGELYEVVLDPSTKPEPEPKEGDSNADEDPVR